MSADRTEPRGQPEKADGGAREEKKTAGGGRKGKARRPKPKAEEAGKGPRRSGAVKRKQGPTPEAAGRSTPLDSSEPPMVVGIGASAGGLAALRTFFANTPDDTGLPFVVVVHLSPEHESHLAPLLQPHCAMPVEQISADTQLEPNRVYVIPPNANIETIDTHLRLSELEKRPRERATIDHFFRTLADTHDGSAIGVVLTGTGSDGTLGLRRIKEAGGVTIAQDPEDAEYDGMPSSAIASGMVDVVLPVDQIPSELVRIATTRPRIPVVVEEEPIAEDEERLLQRVFAEIGTATGHDFSQYKRSTVIRRIRRRMQLQHVDGLSKYLKLLRSRPEENRELVNDLLITVTEFFRDEDVFTALEKRIIPRLFSAKGPQERLRVWSVGCSTGEEAYSIAMLLREEAGRHDSHPELQVFASDLHERALASAREGIYPAEIAADVSPQRLQRFFLKENSHYRVRPEVRDLVVFAAHNLLADPPFSHLDLIVCRNLLIYLQRDVQHDVLRLFHYALEPGGLLLLGTSETVDRSDLFTSEDKHVSLFRKRNVPVPEPRLPAFPVRRGERLRVGSDEASQAPVPAAWTGYGALHERIVERYAPPSVLINTDNEVVHSSARAGRYLVLPGGEPTTDVFMLAREPLQAELRAVLYAARESGRPAHSRPIPLQLGGEPVEVEVRALPAVEPDLDGFCLVIFDELDEPAPSAGEEEGVRVEAATVRELEAELALGRRRLQTVIAQYESSREEMQASNEELQSANEELRSTMEELETSKEELQSMNEELATVNQENRHRAEELRQLADDLQNLLASTDIATLFLDRELNIVRFTPRVRDLFNVRDSDLGRPLSDITDYLGYEGLLDDALRVIERLAPVQRELQGDSGRWYELKMQPYRDAGDRIAGVVISLIDITDLKRAELEWQRQQSYLDAVLEALPVGVVIADRGGRIVRHNPATRELWGELPEAASWQDYGAWVGWRPATGERIKAEEWALTRALLEGEDTRNELVQNQRFGAGDRRYYLDNASPIRRDGEIVGAAAAMLDVTERLATERALADSERRYRELYSETAPAFCIVEVLYGRDGGAVDCRFVEVSPSFSLHTGIADALGRRMTDIAPEHENHWLELYDRVARTGRPERFEGPVAAPGRELDVYAWRVGEPEQHLVAVLFNDVSDRTQERRETREAGAELMERVRDRTEELRRGSGRDREGGGHEGDDEG